MRKQIRLKQDKHFENLKEAYKSVGDRTWAAEDFLEENLQVSRNIFTPESLQACKPKPKDLEVFALVSGLPFAEGFTGKLISIQRQISNILGKRLHYWVAPQNLGIEYCVFKWPTDTWNPEWHNTIQSELASIRQPAFQFRIGGVQVNSDGCVIARGYDENGVLFRIREQLKTNIPFLPAKQSGWAHVPLGRILEPLGAVRFAQLAQLMDVLSDAAIATTEIDNMKFIHERRWYMEERITLSEYTLAGNGEEGKA